MQYDASCAMSGETFGTFAARSDAEARIIARKRWFNGDPVDVHNRTTKTITVVS